MNDQALLEQLRTKYNSMKAQGMGESTSKSMGKLSQQIRALKSKLGVSGSSGTTSSVGTQAALSTKFATEGNDFIKRYQAAIPDIYNRLWIV